VLRVGVVGARRARQGIGEYVARELHLAGAEVVAVAGTSARSAAEAAEQLKARHGIRARPYAGTAAMIAGERLDALAVCTPNEAHEEGLRAALAAGLHCLCDKPLHFDATRDRTDDVRAVVEGFTARGLLLETTTQWPDTLEAYFTLYPELLYGPPPEGSTQLLSRPSRTFAMRLAPLADGVPGLVDSLPHPLSLLRAVLGPGEARGTALRGRGGAGLVLEFTYRHARGETRCELSTRPKDRQPRPASYAFDGRGASREIRLPAYDMELVGAAGRRVPLRDPLRGLVRGFTARVASGARTDAAGLLSDARALEALLRPII